MDIIVFSIAIIVVAALIAFLEIQIEGPNGWAAQLPTWHMKNGLTDTIMGKRPLTGYHVFLILTVLAFIHLPLLFVEWSGLTELKLIGFFIVLMTVEDFLWFVFNPAWGIRRFHKSTDLWWHPDWLLGLPTFYWISLPLGILAILWGFGIIG